MRNGGCTVCYLSWFLLIVDVCPHLPLFLSFSLPLTPSLSLSPSLSSSLFPSLSPSLSLYSTVLLKMKNDTAVMTKNMASTVQKVEMKLLFIPIFFILLRIWSLLLTIIEIEAGKHLSCTALLFFLHVGVSL